MTSLQHDYNDKINKFLFGKKASGTPKEKIPIYLNMLKFFVSHLEKKNLRVEEIDNPVSEVFDIKFEGLEERKEGDIRNLFLDFVHFCKGQIKIDTLEGTFAVDSETKPVSKIPSIKPAAKKPPSIKKAESKVQTIKRGKLSYILLLAFALLLIYGLFRMLLPRNETLTISGTDISVSTDIKVDTAALESYGMEIEGNLESLDDIIDTWGRLKLTESSWKPEYEMAYNGIVLLNKNLKNTAPPQPLVKYHKRLEILSGQIQEELLTIKKYFGSKTAIISGTQRQGRLFNSVNILMRDIDTERKFYYNLVKGVCAYNDVKACL